MNYEPVSKKRRPKMDHYLKKLTESRRRRARRQAKGKGLSELWAWGFGRGRGRGREAQDFRKAKKTKEKASRKEELVMMRVPVTICHAYGHWIRECPQRMDVNQVHATHVGQPEPPSLPLYAGQVLQPPALPAQSAATTASPSSFRPRFFKLDLHHHLCPHQIRHFILAM